jgi:hypothetical protein
VEDAEEPRPDALVDGSEQQHHHHGRVQVPVGTGQPTSASIPSPAFQEGRIMAPTGLSVGSHQLVGTISDPSGGPPDVLEITFFIDASGTGVCL